MSLTLSPRGWLGPIVKHRLLCIGLCAILVTVGGCTKAPLSGTASGPVYSTSPSPTPTPERKLEIAGVDADVTALMRKLYAGESVPSSGAGVPEALGQRKPPATKPVQGTGSMGDWHGTTISSVVVGEDVTLLVRGGTEWRVVGGWWPSLGVAQRVPTGKRFVLAIGSDARPGEDRLRSRGDAIQIMGFDGGTSGGVLGIARDTYVDVGGGNDKINAALTRGGPDLMLTVVKQVSGLPIEGYIITDFDGFVGTINSAGGLNVDFPNGLPAGIPVPPGPTTLNGNAALAAARERYNLPGGDFDRSYNQGLLLGFAALQMKQKGPAQLAAATSPISRWTTSNLNAEQALTFFSTAIRVEPKNVGHAVCKGTVDMVGGASVVIPGSREQNLYASFTSGALPA